jgi:hypothetical protein
MMNARAISWRSAVVALIVAFGGAAAGIAVAPSQAAASPKMDKESCGGSDSCVPGTSECCWHTPNPPGQGQCSTTCEIIIPEG